MPEFEDLELLAFKIDTEGFDYFFRFYSSPKDFPESIREEVKAYIAAAEDLERALRELGVEL